MSKHKKRRLTFVRVISILYPLFLMLYLVTQFQFANWSEFAVYDMHAHNIYPFETLREGFQQYGIFYIDLLVNIALFIPIGILACTDNSRPSILAATGLGMLISFGTELLQYLLGTGILNIDDIMLNFVGVFIGAIIYHIVKAFQKVFTKNNGKRGVNLETEQTWQDPRSTTHTPDAAYSVLKEIREEEAADDDEKKKDISTVNPVQRKIIVERVKWQKANNIISIATTFLLPFIVFFVVALALTAGAYSFAFWHPLLFIPYFGIAYAALLLDFKKAHTIIYFSSVVVFSILFFFVFM